jgi:hypothetical protein
MLGMFAQHATQQLAASAPLGWGSVRRPKRSIQFKVRPVGFGVGFFNECTLHYCLHPSH